MTLCFFVSDLHGCRDKYEKLFEIIRNEKPGLLFLGGDLLPAAYFIEDEEIDFIEYFSTQLKKLKSILKNKYPEIFLILGNDDVRIYEKYFIDNENNHLWNYIHNKMAIYKDYHIYGYSYIPPTPFLLKDWERYDVSTYVDPGCVHPTEGYRSVKTDEDIQYSTIQKGLAELTKNETNYNNCIFLFHSPPYNTFIDRAALDGKMIDHVPLDVHVGSIAIQKFIKDKQPFITMHGHVHESPRLTGFWQQKLKKTFTYSACHDGPELAIVKYHLEEPDKATREIY